MTAPAETCGFCRIVAGSIPSDRIAENDEAIVIRDLAPVASSHLLVVPKRHVADAANLDATHGALLASMIGLANSAAAVEGIDQSGYRLIFNVGDDAGNTVAHLHLHVIGGRAMTWPPG